MVTNPFELFFKCLQNTNPENLHPAFDPDDLTLDFTDWWDIYRGWWEDEHASIEGAIVFEVKTAEDFTEYCEEYDDTEHFGVFITKQSSHAMIKKKFAEILQQMYPVERGRPTNQDRRSNYNLCDFPIGSTQRIEDLALSMKVYEAVKAQPSRPKWRIAVDHKVSSFHISKSSRNKDPEGMHHDADERRELRREVTRRCNRIKDLIAGVEDVVVFPAPPGYRLKRKQEAAAEGR